MRVNGPNGLVINFPDGTDPQTIDRVMRDAMQKRTPDERITGAFDASQPVRQVDKLQEPRSGMFTERDRLGDVSFKVPEPLTAIGGAMQTVGDVYAGRTEAMVPDTGQGVTNPQVETAAKTLAAVALPVNPALRAGDRAIPGVARAAVRREPKPVPAQADLKAAGNAGYNEARDMGVDFDPGAIAQFASVGRAKLDQRSFNEVNAANTYAVLKGLESRKGQFVQLDDLEEARRQLMGGATSAKDAEAARTVIQGIDRLMETPPPASLMAGAASPERAAQAGAIIKDARGNWAALERSKEVAGRAKSAKRRAKASNSGLNIDNTLRQRVSTLLDQIEKGQVRGFSAAEIKAMNEFSNGTKGRNSVRFLANWLGGGGGLGTFASTAAGVAGALAGQPQFLALPAAGLGMKLTQNAMGKRAMGGLDESLRKRSPLYQNAPQPPATVISPEQRAAMMRMMMLYGPGALGPPTGGGGY